MALLAQTVIHRLRRRLGEPYQQWDAQHLTNAVLRGMEGDVRVVQDRIIVTYYKAQDANLLRSQYEGLPEKLEAENIDPRVPWLYGFKLDFRFK